jgi:hypothetical protein
MIPDVCVDRSVEMGARVAVAEAHETEQPKKSFLPSLLLFLLFRRFLDVHSQHCL